VRPWARSGWHYPYPAGEPNERLNCRCVGRSPADRSAVAGLASRSCALNWDNHGCGHSGERCLAERCRSPPRDCACRQVQGVVGVSAMDFIAGCLHLYSQKFPSRTARPERTGGCAAPAVLIPERFRITDALPLRWLHALRAALSSRLIEVLQYRNLSEYGRLRLRWSLRPPMAAALSPAKTHVVVSWS
jgi:hypothetical protein